MAVIGKTTVGLTDFVRTSGGMVSGPYMASEDGIIDTISVFTNTLGVSMQAGVYLQDEAFLSGDTISPRPTTLVAATASVPTTVAGWQTNARSSGTGVIERGKRYWIGAVATGSITYREDFTRERMRWGISSLSNPFTVGGGATVFRALSAYFSYTPIPPDVDDMSLQARINRANPGDTVLVRGFQNERVIINKPIRLVGLPNRRTGALPIIQGGDLVTVWTLSTASEHTDKNVWYKDIRIGPNNSDVAVFIRAVQLDEKSVPLIQSRPFLWEGYTEEEATALREYVLTCDWVAPGFFVAPGETIDFWQWYDAIACHDTSGRLWLRLKNGVNPNDSVCYVTATHNGLQTTPSSNPDIFYSNEVASVIKCENQSEFTISNIEIRGGRRGIDIHNSSNFRIEQCKVVGSNAGIDLVNCSDFTIDSNEITLKPMQTNLGAGIGGTTTRANAMKFGRSIGKNASAGQPVSITLTGVTSGVTITRNHMHDIGSGVAWGEGLDVHLIDADIKDNHFEKMSSTGLIVFGKATGSARNNKFYEVHFALRIQDMNVSAAVNALDGLVVIENNFIKTFENAGFVMQQHNAAGTIWTTQVQFNSNFIQNVSTLIANMLSAADVSMDGNVIDCSAPITNQLFNLGMTSFTNNWIGGNIATTPSRPWYGTGNQYTLNQRLNGLTPPAGYTFPTIAQSVGPRKQRGWFAWNE